MKMDKNFYEILDVSESADTAAIKKQYHKMVRKYHPDIAKDVADAHELFIAINEAYKTLKDPELRAAYDFGLAEAREYAKHPHPEKQEEPQEEILIETPDDRRRKEVQFSSMLDKVRAMVQQSKPNEASQLLDKALELKKDSAEGWELKGDIYRSMRSFDVAMAAYSKAAQLAGGNNSAIKEKLMDTVAERSGRPRKATNTANSTKKKGGFFGKLFG